MRACKAGWVMMAVLVLGLPLGCDKKGRRAVGQSAPRPERGAVRASRGQVRYPCPVDSGLRDPGAGCDLRSAAPMNPPCSSRRPLTEKAPATFKIKFTHDQGRVRCGGHASVGAAGGRPHL